MTAQPLDSNDPKVQSSVLAFIRQELSAPVSTIIGYAELLIEDATQAGFSEALSDLRRIHTAGMQLQTLVRDLVESGRAGSAHWSPKELRARLRHDLRTPLNAVKGYSEMLREVAEETGHAAFAQDLGKLVDASGALLARIEALLGVTRTKKGHGFSVLEILKHGSLPETLARLHDTGGEQSQRTQAEPSFVLVVDDNAENRDLLVRRLARDGHRVAEAADGPTALALAVKQPPDLIMLDLIMPGMNGFEVLTRLKANDATASVPVIMVSALEEADSVVRCIEAGAEDFLSKPWDPTILRARVNSTLDRKRLRDRERRFLDQLREAHGRTELLLLSILPQSVAARLNSGETMIADRYADVTVLFADIVGFTGLSSDLTASEIISMLDAVFTEFDRLAMDIGIEKIKTIGDAYMAVAGLPDPAPDHAMRAVRLGMQMLEAADSQTEQFGRSLKLRVGIHTGPVVAGIIGRQKFAFDIWGDTVNIASRMESQGVPGRIQVSQDTYDRLKNDLDWEPRGTVEVRGKGPMETYLLKR